MKIILMADNVNHIDPQHNHLPQTDWRKLGELNLQTGSNPDGSINAWLTHILSDFSLPNDLVNKLLKSMEDAAGRVLLLDGAEAQLEHLEIVVLVPADLVSQGQIWGFFRVERTSTDPDIEASQVHSIDYYLYIDRTGEPKHTP
ncbi:MAG TPA: hypothetical protein VK897_28010 [Anaerolineales bacterium]|nr:hypothetical protein [Anaerolineales bacterium]